MSCSSNHTHFLSGFFSNHSNLVVFARHPGGNSSSAPPGRNTWHPADETQKLRSKRNMEDLFNWYYQRQSESILLLRLTLIYLCCLYPRCNSGIFGSGWSGRKTVIVECKLDDMYFLHIQAIQQPCIQNDSSTTSIWSPFFLCSPGVAGRGGGVGGCPNGLSRTSIFSRGSLFRQCGIRRRLLL